jgi:MFS family permease
MTPRAATFLMFVVNGAIVGTWIALIPGIQERLAIPADQLGLILFFAALGALIGQQITGQLLVRVSSRVVLTVAALAFPFLIVLPALAPSATMLAAVLFLYGYFNTTMDVTMNAHGVALETAGGKSILSGLHAGWSIGGVVGALAVAAGVAAGVDPVAEALVAAAVLWLVALVASRFLGTGSVKTEGASGIHLPGRAVLPIALLVVLIAFVEGGLTDWGGVYLRQGLLADAEIAAIAYAAFALGLFIGRIGGDWAKDRIGSVRLIQWGMLLTAVVIAAFLVIGSDVVALLGMVLAGIGIANTIPQLFGAAGRISPSGPSLSAVFTFLTLAFMVGPLLIGSTAEAFSIGTAFGLFVVASLAVAVIVGRVPVAETNPRFQR